MKPVPSRIDVADLVLCALLVLLSVGWLDFIQIRRWRLDDSFFGYTYAKNIAEGNGFTFNRVKVLGTSAPLPVLLYSTTSVVFGVADIKSIAETASILAIALTSVLLFKFVSDLTDMKTAGVLSAVSYNLNPFVVMLFGHESILALLLVIAALLLQHSKQPLLGYFALGLAFLCRAESIFAGLYMGYRTLCDIPLKAQAAPSYLAYVCGFFAPLLAWYSFSYLYFGQLLSNSFKFKVLQSTISGTHFLQGLVNFVTPLFKSTNLGLWGGMSLAGLCGITVFGVFKNRAHQVLVLSLGAAPIFFYCALDIAFYPWFLFLFGLLLSMLVGLSLRVTVEKCRSESPRVKLVWNLLVALIVLVTLHTNYNLIKQRVPRKDSTPYQALGEYLRDHTSRDASIGYVEVGQIAYYGQRRIVDLTGLVSKGVVEHLKAGDSNWAYEEYKPDYIVDDPRFGWLYDFSASTVQKDYHLFHTFDFGSGHVLMLYARNGSADS